MTSALLDEVHAFFRAYAQAFAAEEFDAVASLHHVPCVKVHGDGRVECLSSPDEVSAFFRRLLETYRGRGHADARFLDVEAVPIGSQAALASLTWEQRRADGAVYRRFRRSYNLVRGPSGWRILLATAHRA